MAPLVRRLPRVKYTEPSVLEQPVKQEQPAPAFAPPQQHLTTTTAEPSLAAASSHCDITYSSEPSESPDSAGEMDDQNRGPTKQLSDSEDHELVFRGRSIGRSNTAADALIGNASWRYDRAAGTFVGNAGEAWKPTLPSKTTKLSTSIKPANLEAEMNAPCEDQPAPDSGHPPLPKKAAEKQQQKQLPSKPLNHNGRVRVHKQRESPWIKDKDIAKGDPNRHKARWSSPSHESASFGSNRASSGWGTRRKRKGGDNGADLADWTGGLGPAAIDWDSRSQFRDHQSSEKIETWLQITCSELTGAEEIKLATDQGAIAPRYWIHTHLEGKTINVFWSDHIASEKLKPVDEGDLSGAKPWWETYVSAESCVLKDYEHPGEVGTEKSWKTAQFRRQVELQVRENKLSRKGGPSR